MFKLRIRNAAQIVTVTSNGQLYKAGSDMDSIDIITNGTIIVNQQGNIEDIGSSETLMARYSGATFGMWSIVLLF